jgi:hypothetical protein
MTISLHRGTRRTIAMRSVASIMMLAVALALSCARGSPVQAGKKPVEEPRPTPSQPPSLHGQGFESADEAVELHAAALKNKIHIEVINKGLTVLRVSPYHFGIIVKKNLTIYDPKTAMSQFPSAVLNKGERASGNITFRGFESLAGQKLVFNNPDYKPIMAIIADASAAVKEAETQPAPESPTPTPEAP